MGTLGTCFVSIAKPTAMSTWRLLEILSWSLALERAGGNSVLPDQRAADDEDLRLLQPRLRLHHAPHGQNQVQLLRRVAKIYRDL